MYDRLTNSIWHQFTGEPVIGPLADSGIKLPFFPVLLTTWGEWVAEHPDTTVLSPETGIYPASRYAPESDFRSLYYSYRQSPETMFPVWNQSDALAAKDVILGLEIDNAYKAYPVKRLQQERVVNDALAGTEVVIIASSNSQAARAYERDGGHQFAPGAGESTADGLPITLVDDGGSTWQVTEEYLVNADDPSLRLERIPTHTSFWFGWYGFHPDTQIYGQDDS